MHSPGLGCESPCRAGWGLGAPSRTVLCCAVDWVPRGSIQYSVSKPESELEPKCAEEPNQLQHYNSKMDKLANLHFTENIKTLIDFGERVPQTSIAHLYLCEVRMLTWSFQFFMWKEDLLNEIDMWKFQKEEVKGMWFLNLNEFWG